MHVLQDLNQQPHGIGNKKIENVSGNGGFMTILSLVLAEFKLLDTKIGWTPDRDKPAGPPPPRS